MGIPWILHAALAASLLPFLGAALRRAPLTSGRRWILAWTGVTILANLIALAYALQGRNNHWIAYVHTPIESALALWALSHWQRTPVATLAFRVLVPLLALTWIGIVIALENTRTFSQLAEPFAGLLVLGGATYTLVSRASAESGSLLRQDWLWVALGLALYSGTAIALPPASRWLLAKYPELVARAYEARALAIILAQVAIALGFLCPALTSGGSSSRASSPSRSSSSASSSPW